jgi:hypothetical protein
MYISKRGRGFGQCAADMRSWGYISPCGGDSSTTAAPTTAAPGAACAPAASFPFFGTADGAGNCQPASPGLTLAGAGVVLLLLYGFFEGGR